MANRNWNRANYYGGAYGVPSIGYYVPPPERRYVNNAPYNKGYSNYRDDKRRDDRKRPHSPSRDRRDMQRNDQRASKRGPQQTKYDVRIPKHQIASKHLTCLDLKGRLPRLTIPSDLAHVSCNWTESYPLNEPMNMNANYSYSARVMFLGTPSMGEMMKNSCVMADDTSSDNKLLAAKNFNFLVGGRIRTECMALGGPWSPSMDGASPEKNPKTLINTAIRTFKGYTGVDLSSCNEWIRFMEIKYQRQAGTKAPAYAGEEDERVIENDCVETVVFYVPVVGHMRPSETDWASKKEHYSTILQKLLSPKESVKETKETDTPAENADDSVLDDSTMNTSAEATHYSKLDVNALKVSDLKNELNARGIEAKGLKAALITKLEAVLATEKEKEENSNNKDENDTEEQTESEQNSSKQVAPEAASAETKEKVEEVSERDRRRLERLYRLDDKPAVLIHPNSSVRAGKFDCHRATLCSLLDYRHDDPKEMGFEVVLFAQQFNEMLQRDCIFNIFRAVFHAPDREVKEETKYALYKFLFSMRKGNNVRENGVNGHEPDVKRLKEDDENLAADDGDKIRKHKRTFDPKLLFSFVFFDTGRSDFIRDPDLIEMIQLLDLGYSKSQIRKWVNRVGKRKDHVQYRNLTDKEVVENSDDDVTNFKCEKMDMDDLRKLSIGNVAVLNRNAPPSSAKVILGGDARTNERLEKAESARKDAEFKFFKLKEEFENARVTLNGFKDVEDKLKADNKDLTQRLKNEQKSGTENRVNVGIYGKLLREAKFHMERSLNDINKQFEKEKEKRDAERAETEKAKEEQNNSDEKTVKKEEGDIVVDTA